MLWNAHAWLFMIVKFFFAFLAYSCNTPVVPNESSLQNNIPSEHGKLQMCNRINWFHTNLDNCIAPSTLKSPALSILICDYSSGQDGVSPVGKGPDALLQQCSIRTSANLLFFPAKSCWYCSSQNRLTLLQSLLGTCRLKNLIPRWWYNSLRSWSWPHTILWNT